MNERKNIDRLFQEKFKDFEADPHEKVWENIEAKLKEKETKRVVPFWFRLSGIAAALLLGLFLASQYFSDKLPRNEVVVEENKPISSPKNNGSTIKSEGIAKENQGIANENDSDSNINNQNTQDSGNSRSSTNSAPNAIPRQTGKLNSINNNDIVESANKNQKKSNQKNTIRNSTIEKEAYLEPEKLAAANQKSNEAKSQIERSQTSTGNNNNDALQHNAIAEIGKNSDDAAADQVKTKNQEDFPNSNSKSNAAENALNKTSDGNPASNSGIADADTKKTDTTAVAAVVPNALEELLNEKEQEKKQLTTAEPKLNRWQITSNVAPIYFSSTSNGSPLDTRFEANNKSYAPTVSIGAGVQYALNKKLALRSGVNSVALEYNTSDVIFFQTDNARRIENVKANVQGSLIQVDNKAMPVATTLGRIVKQYNGSLNQRTSYVEVPVEMSYKLVDKKFGVDVIGGFSTLFLNENEVTIIGSGVEMNIGEANNLNDVHFSTNLGLGIKYKFLKSFQVHLEPTFKYQINTYSSDAGNFKPYFLGLYTGVSYRF